MGVFSFVKAGKKIYGTIKSVKPALGKSKLKKAVDDVKLSSLKAKGKMKRSFQKMEEDIDPARIKLRQTTQKLIGEPVTKSGVSKGKDMKKFKTPSLNPKPINKAMGGRVGRKFGNPKPKTNIQKIKETFAPKGKNLKPVDKKKNPGLAKLPTKVRNKMGYMKSGGRA